MKKILVVISLLLVWLTLPGVQAATYSYRNDVFAGYYDTPSGTAASVTWHAGTDGTWLGSPACTSYPNGDDDWADVVFPSGFTFVYGGFTYSQVRVYSNGMLAFGNDVSGFHRDYTPQALPITAAGTPGITNGTPVCTYSAIPANLMIAYWTDIVAGSAKGVTGDAIKYELLGTAPSRRFVITWNNVALYSTTTTRYTFQIALFESASGVNGPFEYRYTSGASTGTGAAVGVQLSTADYTQYAYNQAFIDTSNGTRILWYPQTTLVSAAAVYHFDEATWNGTAGQVIDSSGNVPAQNATSVGAATTVVSTKCGSGRAGSFPANTSNTVISAVATPFVPGNTGSVDFWYNSNVAWNAANSQAMLFDATTVAGSPFYLMKTATGALQFTVSSSAAAISTTTSAAQTFAANTWQHIAVSWLFLVGTNQTYIQIFLNGTLLTSARYTTTGTIASLSTLYIGDNRSSGVTPSGGSPNSANGLIDEVKIYTAQINTFQETSDQSCTALIDHLLIQSSGSGLSCAANTLNIVACQNAACTVNYTAGVIGTLTSTPVSPPGTTVIWDGTTGGAAGAGFATGGSGTASKNMQVTLPITSPATTSGTVTFGIVSPTPVPTNATVCNFGNNVPANNCVFTSNAAGLLLTNSTSGPTSTTSYTIQPQVSGITLSGLYWRALQASNNNPAVCTPAVINSSTPLNIGYTCNNPSVCQAGNLATINATAIAPAGTAVSLTFDATGSAPFTARYDDVGQITLNAAAPAPFSGATATLTGSSNAYNVGPHHFGISGVTTGPIKAGNNFSAMVTAYNGLATTTSTPNFGKETPSPEGVTLSFTKCKPTGTNSSTGTLSGGVGTFASGAATATNLNWSEVGNGDLVAKLASGNYLASIPALTPTPGNTGTGGTVCSTSGAGNVGTFIPDHFDTVVTGPMTTCPTVVPALTCAAGGMAYSGQPFATQVTAKNAICPSGICGTTQNYDGTTNTAPNFANGVALSAYTVAGGSTLSPNGTLWNSSVVASTFAKGIATPVIPPLYAFSTTPTAPTNIYVRAMNADATSKVPGNEGGITVVSGRLFISNAFGSEMLNLTIPVTAQFWNGGYMTSSTDGSSFVVSTPPAAGAFSFGNYLQSLTAISVVGSPYTMSFTTSTATGAGSFTLNAPGNGKNGSVDISVPTGTTCTTTPTLGCYLPSITGRATFGVYKGSNQFIYQRESY